MRGHASAVSNVAFKTDVRMEFVRRQNISAMRRMRNSSPEPQAITPGAVCLAAWSLMEEILIQTKLPGRFNGTISPRISR